MAMLSRSFHLFLFWLNCFEVLFCQNTEEDLLSIRIRTQTPAIFSESPNLFEEPSIRRPKELLPHGGDRYLNRNRKSNMTNTEYLYNLIGDDFKPEWMSATKPKKPWKPVALHEVSLNISEEVLASRKHLRLFEGFNFTKEFAQLQPDLLPYENKIKSWLTQRSSCPVAFTWKNLGPTFWPRWFRAGYCMDRNRKCSLPFGCMKCKSEGVIHLYFLHQKCTKQIRKERSVIYELKKKESKSGYTSSKTRERCELEKVSIPVTVACSCAC